MRIDGVLEVMLDRPRSGEFEFEFQWRAVIDDVPEGLYRVPMGPGYALVTQFQPSGARTVFPCFDDPGVRIQYELSITVEPGHRAWSNMPVVSERHGRTRSTYRFAGTPPLPAWALALVVGAFDEYGANQALSTLSARDQPLPWRSLVEDAGAAIRWLEQYLDTPMPFPKVRLAAVPSLTSDAAEYPGLLVFLDHVLRPARDEPGGLARLRTVGHELAHQWFGGLVSPRSWSDVWLAEGPATWLEGRIVAAVRQTERVDHEALTRRALTIDEDAAGLLRALAGELHGPGHIYFDVTAYDKGAGLFDTIEAVYGAERLRELFRKLLRRFAWRSIDTEDFLTVAEEVLGAPARDWLDPMVFGFGAPCVRIERCRTGGLRVTSDRLPQRLLMDCRGPDGSRLRPVSADGLLQPPEGWAVHPNTEERMWCTWTVPPEMLERLSQEVKLSTREQVVLPLTMLRHFESERMALGLLLSGASSLAREATPSTTATLAVVVDRLCAAAAEIGGEDWQHRRWAGELLQRLMARVPDQGDPATRELNSTIRHRVLVTLVRWVPNEELLAELVMEGLDWLGAPGRPAERRSGLALGVAAAEMPHVAARVRQELREESIPLRRRALLVACCAPRDRSALEAGFATVFEPRLLAHEVLTLLGAVRQRVAAQRVLAQWLGERWPEYADRVGGETATWTPWLFDALPEDELTRVVDRLQSIAPTPGMLVQAGLVARLARRRARLARRLQEEEA